MGIRRFRDTLLRLRGDAKHSLLIWKYSTPQHFPTPSGMYDWRGVPGAPWNRWGPFFDNCVPIKHPSASYGRNTIAEHILAPMFANRSMVLMTSSWADTAKNYQLH